MLSGIRSSWGLDHGQSRRVPRADQISQKRFLRKRADRDLRGALNLTRFAALPLPARDLSPGRTPGTLSNSIGVNGHDGLLKWWRWRELKPDFPSS